MIRNVLVPALHARFPDRGLRTGDPPEPIAVFPAARPEVGDLCIWGDGDVATAAIGEVTHDHFSHMTRGCRLKSALGL